MPWLYGVARRVLANDRRAARRRRDLSDRLAVQPQADAHAEEVIGLTDVARAFSRLSSQDQEVLRLCLWKELTPSEIAQVLGQAQIAVRVRLHRARQRLQKPSSSDFPDPACQSGGYLAGGQGYTSLTGCFGCLIPPGWRTRQCPRRKPRCCGCASFLRSVTSPVLTHAGVCWCGRQP
ncbi:sigma-70 family RNA polymerase sigma factor [Streptomyces anulatus]|uniref:RNA polymerase sigma factor n=2 Tax=Streptomyces anulatus TaxID=1892 RepID=UPI00343D0F1A